MAVRRERVILDLEGNFESKAGRDAAAIALLKRELDGLSGRAVRARRPLQDTERDLDRVGNAAKRNRVEVERMSGNMRLLADAAAVFGPALAPLGAASIGAMAGFANQLGMAASAAGVAMLAFHGVGAAVKALNQFQLEPTAQNLAAVTDKMAGLAPAARDFARTLSSMMPEVRGLQQSAAAGLFPGLTDALGIISARGPEVNTIISELATAMGQVAKEGAKSLASPQWDAFFTNFETTAKPTLVDMGHALGNVAKAAADLWVAFSPLTTDFSKGLVDATAALERWTAGLAGSTGFQHFVDYIEKSGPQVLHLLGQLGVMFVDLARAVAPLGGPSTQILGSMADMVSHIASSDMGTPIFAGLAALALFNRTLLVTQKLQAATFGGPAAAGMKGWGTGVKRFGRDLSTSLTTLQFTAADTQKVAAANERLGASFKSFGKGALAVGALGLATTDLGDKLHVTHAAMFGLMGMMAGPWGAAVGAAAGGIWDFVDAFHGWNTVVQEHWTPQAREARTRVDEMTRANFLLGQGLGLTAAGARAAAAGIQTFSQQVDIMNGRLSNRADMRGFQQALDDFTKSLAQNGRTLDINTQKGRDNQAALDNIASTALRVAQNMTGLNRVRFLQSARRDFIAAAMQAGMTRAAAQKLADRLISLNTIHARPKVTLDAAGVKPQLDAIWGVMDQIIGTHNAVLHYTTTGTPPKGLGGLLTPNFTPPKKQNADGGTIAGPRAPYGDKVFSMLAPGEEVISNRHGQADRFRPLLKAINANRLADGGTARRGSAWRGSAAHSFDLFGGQSMKQLENEFWQLARSVHTHGGHLGKGFDALEIRAKRLNLAWDRSNVVLQREIKTRDDLVNQQDQLKSAVGDALKRNPFDPSNVWMSQTDRTKAGMGIFGTLQGDIANAGRFNDLAKTLGKNVHGQALAAVEAQGVDAMAMVAGMSAAEQKRYQSMFDQRDKAVSVAQSTAGRSLQPLIDAQAAQVTRLESQLRIANKRLNQIEKTVERSAGVAGRETGRQLNKAHAAGHRKGRG